MTRAVVLAALTLAACGGADLRGATSVAELQEPLGEPRGRFFPSDCVDERGQPATAPEAELRVVELADGRRVLFEARTGHDGLLVTNRFDAGGETVFQFVSESAEGPALLHERRFPRSGERAGSLLVADRFESADTASGFRATAEHVVLRCALRRAP